jgi:predicted glycosyltransferase
MRILFDIGHPAHVHLFKEVASALKDKGHYVLFVSQDIPVATSLLKHYNLNYKVLGKKKKSLIGKALSQVWRTVQLSVLIRVKKINLCASSTPSLMYAARINYVPGIFFDDDDDFAEPLVVKYAHPSAYKILSPSSIERKSRKNISYFGTHELSYLHPNNFDPDVEVLKRLNLKPNDRFYILRFVAFQGHHDSGHFGLNLSQKIELVTYLEQYGRVYITSEKRIEKELEKYRLPVPAYEMHTLLFYATMFIGDSQTMTSEAAILGTPAIKCNTFAGELSVPNELEKEYGLCYSYLPRDYNLFLKMIKKLNETPNLKDEWSNRRKALLEDKIDVATFIVWLLEYFPDSIADLEQDSNIQKRFK